MSRGLNYVRKPLIIDNKNAWKNLFNVGKNEDNKNGPKLHERVVFTFHNEYQYQLTHYPQKKQSAEENLVSYERPGSCDLSENVQSLELSGVRLPGQTAECSYI